MKQIKRIQVIERYDLEGSRNDSISTSDARMVKTKYHKNLEYVDPSSLATEVEGRAVNMKATIDDIIREDPRIVQNRASIKKKLKDRLKTSNKYSLYVLEEDKIADLIRSSIYAYKKENDPATPKDMKLKIGRINAAKLKGKII